MDGQRSHLQLDIYKKGVKNSNTSHRLPIGSEKKKQFRMNPEMKANLRLQRREANRAKLEARGKQAELDKKSRRKRHFVNQKGSAVQRAIMKYKKIKVEYLNDKCLEYFEIWIKR